MTIEIALLVSGISVAFGIYMGIVNMRRNTKTDDRRDASQMTTVIVKLENISSVISEIKGDLSNIRGDISAVKNDTKELSERLIVVEQSVKQAHKRVDDICKKG